MAFKAIVSEPLKSIPLWRSGFLMVTPKNISQIVYTKDTPRPYVLHLWQSKLGSTSKCESNFLKCWIIKNKSPNFHLSSPAARPHVNSANTLSPEGVRNSQVSNKTRPNWLRMFFAAVDLPLGQFWIKEERPKSALCIQGWLHGENPAMPQSMGIRSRKPSRWATRERQMWTTWPLGPKLAEPVKWLPAPWVAGSP